MEKSAQEQVILNDLVNLLPTIPSQHKPKTAVYDFLNKLALSEARRIFSGRTNNVLFEGPLRGLQFPYYEMGNINSLDLFGLDEIIIFSFYWQNRHRYKYTLDLGANIGLHSIVMSQCGYRVRSYEPDPQTYARLTDNLHLNKCQNVEPINAAVSTRSGEMEFTRVLGNMTGSHLSGAKTNPYGELEKFKVRVEEFVPLLRAVDFCKIDIEGHESAVLVSTNADDWKKADAIVEIGTSENAQLIFEHFKKINVNLFCQKNGWQKVRAFADMPTSYREGSLFISCKHEMPWEK